MGTAKRERQKANKAKREQEVARRQARSRTTRIALLVGGGIVAVFVLVFVAGRFIDDGDDTDDTLVTSEEPAVTRFGDRRPAGDRAGRRCGDRRHRGRRHRGRGVRRVARPSRGPTSRSRPSTVLRRCVSIPTPTYSAKITTNIGELTADLDQEQAPNTVNNFVFLARYNYFDDTECHRVIQGFVAQCGDPTATGTGGPGYEFADELPEAGTYQIGSLAMANSGPDTNGSQFFIISGDNGAALPPEYSLFGEVVEADLDMVGELDARGSLDQSGVATEEIRIVDIEIIES